MSQWILGGQHQLFSGGEKKTGRDIGKVPLAA